MTMLVKHLLAVLVSIHHDAYLTEGLACGREVDPNLEDEAVDFGVLAMVSRTHHSSGLTLRDP